MQRNKTCPVAERDVAGTHGIAGKKRDARLIIQAAPFWEEEWPDLLLWKCAALRPFKHSGLWQEWCDKQISFTAALTKGAKALSHPAYGMVGQSMSAYTVAVNQFLKNKVSFSSAHKLQVEVKIK